MKKYLYLLVAFLCVVSTCTVENTQPGDPKYIDSIAITNKINEIATGNQYQFEAEFYPWDAQGFKSFSWQSLDYTVATIDRNGLLQAVSEGRVKVVLTSKITLKKETVELTDSVEINVLPPDLKSIALNQNYVEILNGKTETLTVSFIPVNVLPQVIEWSSNNEYVATVSGGTVTAKNSGLAVITAKVKDTDIKAECSVKVNPVLLSSIRFDTTNIKLETGYSANTVLIFEPNNAENKNVTYSTSNSSIASVNSSGLVIGVSNGPYGQGNGPGRATITATSVEGNLKATCNVEVYSVVDLITVTVELENMSYSPLGLSGHVRATLHNNSSKPVQMVRFRIMDRFNTYSDIYPLLGVTLNAFSSHTINEWLVFKEKDTPRAEFTISYDGNDYRRAIEIK